MDEFKIIRMKRCLNALIVDISNKSFDVDRIILFGSVARGDFNERSDLDVCVVSENIDSRQRLEIGHYFEEFLEDEIEVDFIFCNMETLMEGVSVFQSIREEGLILYENILGNSSGGFR